MIVLLQLNFRRNIVLNIYLFLCSFVCTFNKFHSDIDECVTRTHDCIKEASCSNNIGSFSCSCNLGYFGNGTTCEGMWSTWDEMNLYLDYYLFLDIDECASYNCGINENCRNTMGSFTCPCKYGFERNSSTCIGNPNYCLKFENESLEIISYVYLIIHFNITNNFY